MLHMHYVPGTKNTSYTKYIRRGRCIDIQSSRTIAQAPSGFVSVVITLHRSCA